MNGFDFDNTIYKGDSSFDFYFYCLRKRPKILLSLPYQSFSFLLYALRLINKTQFKECFYTYFKRLGDTDALAEGFWDKKFCRIKSFYLDLRCDDDVIISASPEFLLRIPCEKLGVGCLIASEVDKSTGKYAGLNCHGREKLRRFREKYGSERFERFYSDSLSDFPLAEIAERSFIVKGSDITDWQEYAAKHAKQAKRSKRKR